MPAVTLQDLQRYRYILLYDDEPVANAAIALRDEDAQLWWHVLVDLEEGGYAAARIETIAHAFEKQGEDLLDEPLSALVGDVLTPVEIFGEVGYTDLAALRKEVYASEAQVAVVHKDGEVAGILATSTRGGSGLLRPFGPLDKLPKKGLRSKRRRRRDDEAQEKKSTKKDDDSHG